MYCKNCGKKLPDDARFCDRCNMSVRKIETKMDIIGELKEERLARRKAKAIEERFKKIREIKLRKYKIAARIITGVIALGIISAFATYIFYPKEHEEITEVATETPRPTKAPATASDNPSATQTPKPQAVVNADGYIKADIGGMDFAYPRSFKKQRPGTNMLFLIDENGGGEIIANRVAVSSEPKEMMKSFADNAGGTPLHSLAGSNGYEIKLSIGNEICYRKSIINGGMEFYYQFRYPADSKSVIQYEKDIEYMSKLLQLED